jgi:hypothetical protein
VAAMLIANNATCCIICKILLLYILQGVLNFKCMAYIRNMISEHAIFAKA